MGKHSNRSKTADKRETKVAEKSVVPQEPTPRWIEVLLLIGLVALTLLLFAQSLSNDFTFDDFQFVVENPEIHNWDFGSNPWRWRLHFRSLTYMIDYSLFGDSPIGYHVSNLFWHLLSLLLFYFLIRGITNRVSIAFVAALLFATHPIHVEVVTNITNRKELLCLAFMLTAGISYGRFIQTQSKMRLVWLTIAVIAWILSSFSKQFGIAFPLYVIAYEYLFLSREKQFLLKYPRWLGAGFVMGGILVLAYIFIRAVNLDNLRELRLFQGYAGEPTLFTVAITSARTFWSYVGLLIWPDVLCPDRLVTLSRSFLAPPTTLLSWAGLISLLAVALKHAHRWPLVTFGIFCFFISYLPISNLIPTAYMMADRYMYISSVGFCMVLVGLGETLYHKLQGYSPRYATPVMVCMVGVVIASYSLKTLSYLPHWKNERTLWHYTLGCNPQSFRAYNNLGYQYMKAGDFPKAIELLTKAIHFGYKDAYEHRGTAYLGLKNYEAALQDYNQAIADQLDWDTIYYNRGLVYLEMEQYELAIEDFSRAIVLNPDYSTAYNNRGLAYENLKRLEEALTDYFMATKLDPDNAAAFNNLGRSLVYAGRLKEAIQSYERAEQLGMTQATKILEFLHTKGLPSKQEKNDPGLSKSDNKKVENGEGDRPTN